MIDPDHTPTKSPAPPTAAEDEICVVRLDGDVAAIPSALGALTDALLAGRARYLLLDMGKNATHPALLRSFNAWAERNAVNLRTRARALAILVPRLRDRIPWYISDVFIQKPIPKKTVASYEAAYAFLRAEGRKV